MLSIGINLRVTGHCNQGGRKYMEDMFSVAYQQSSGDRDLEYAFFGIFDGHGGGEAAAFAKEHLMDIIVKQKNFWSDKDEDVLRAIRDGYVNTHYAMWRELDKWPRTASGLPSTAGTTASIAFIRKGKIYIGHVGDSGIILGYKEEGDPQWKAKALTQDHKPESGPEMTRIQESGGKVVCKSGVPRVVWNRPRIGHKGPVRRSTHIDEIPFLAVARALGDLWSYNSELDTFVVSPEPDVKVVTIDVKTHRCLIFGTDGLWNMLTPQAAVAIVQAAERHNEKHLIAAQQNGGGQNDVQMWINPSTSLVDRALERWSSTRLRADNTSVVTLMLDPPGPSRSEVFQNQKREHVPAPKKPVRPVFHPSTPVSPEEASKKPDSNSQIPDPINSPLKTCLSCGSSEKASSSAISSLDQTPPMKESPPRTPITKTFKPIESPIVSESIQVAEVSSSDISEENKDLEVKKPLDLLKPIENGIISLENELPMDSISNLESLIEKVPKPERFPIDKTPMADAEVEKLYAMSRQSAFCGLMTDQGALRTKRVINLDSTTEGEEKFHGLNRHKSFSDNPHGIAEQFGPRPKRSSNLESVAEEIGKSLYPLTRQNSFCEKTKVNAGQFEPGKKRASALESTTDDLSAGIKYARPIIISETKRKQLSSLILHPEKHNLYTNENLKKTNRRHSIGAVPRNTLTAKANLKESPVPYLGCRIQRDSKSLPGNLFEEPKIADSTKPRLNGSLRGVKRRHSAISHANDGSCATGETCAKRRTRSEDRPNPIDENDPANQKLVVEEAHNRLRWPVADSPLTRPGAGVNSNPAGIQERRLSSPNSFQRRNLEKKVTPVKTIRRPSINGSSRILRGIFGIRDWDQGRSNRNVGCPSRHRTVVGLINSVSEPTTPQRWLRSDTIAATPVKTLRSRNVDIAGHTVSAQVAHQYAMKQSRLPVPAKLKATPTSILAFPSPSQPPKSKTPCPATPSSAAKTRQARCAASSVSEGCSNVISTAGITNDSTLTKRVKSPHTLVSPLSTRSRIKRLGK